MTTLEFLSYLRDRDILVRVDGDRLRISAPRGGLTPKLRSELVERKAEILAFLQMAATEAPHIKPAPRDTAVPLSIGQERLWFIDQLDPGTVIYNHNLALRFSGPLDLAALDKSVNEIVRRHESLRTTFPVVDGQPFQLIAPNLRIELPVVDLCDLPEGEREAEAMRLAQERIQQPFDLAGGPLLKTWIYRLAEEQHILLRTSHHIVSDGWSTRVFLRELEALYSAFSTGRPTPLPELSIQYADFAIWQRKWLRGGVRNAQLAYWMKRLDGHLPVLELPTDRPRPTVQYYHGAHESVDLPRTLANRLRELSTREGATLFMTLLAAFKVLLHRYTGQDDVLVGSPTSGRELMEVQGLIGFFLNTLILRTDLSDDPSFRTLLPRVRETVLEAFAHQVIPFEDLLRELQPERSPSHDPLFQVLFVCQDPSVAQLDLPEIKASRHRIPRRTAQFELTLIVREQENGLNASFSYKTDIFEAATIARMLSHLQVLMQSIVDDPDLPISQLPLLTGAERQQLLVDWNDRGVDYPLDLCLHELFELQVERTPDAVAVAFEEQQATYSELSRRANQLAHYLQSLGVEPEMMVGLCMQRSVEWVVGLLGILKAGAAFVPMDPAYPGERLMLMLKNAGLSLVVSSEELLDRLSGYEGRRVCLDKEESSIAHESEQNPDSGTTAANLAYMIFTSGSTGSPKGVMIEHKGLVNLTLAQIDAYDVLPGTRFLQTFALGSDASIAQVTRPLCSGATLQLAPEQSLLPGPDMIRLLLDTGVTHLNLPPSLLQLLPTEELPDVTVVVVGGEACPADLVARWAPGRRFLNAYGPTEATVGSTIHECVADGQPPPIGRPIANKEIYILDSHLQPVPTGVPGELCIGGAGLARGYWDRPDLTAESFIPNPFSSRLGARMYRTGDLAKYRPDGNIEFLGRLDYQVKIRGFRIELGEIESVLGEHQDVREVVLLVKESAHDDERLVAYVVPKGGATLVSSNLRAFLQARLPDHMVPAAWVMLEALPLTPNGKVDRKALPEPDWSRYDPARAYVAPRTPVEEVLADIFVEVLNIDRVGVHDNFFELGGHSLLATRITSRLHASLQAEVPLLTIFEAPTVAELSEAVIAREARPGQTERIAQLRKRIESMPANEVKGMLEQRRRRDPA